MRRGTVHLTWLRQTSAAAMLPAFLVLALALGVMVAGCEAPPTSDSTASPDSTAADGGDTSSGTTASSTVAPVDQDRLDRLEEQALHLIALLTERRFDEAHQDFDTTMQTALPPDKLAEVWDQLEAQVGSYVSVAAVRNEASSGLTAIIVQVEFEQAPIDIRVVYDSQDRVAGLFFQPAQVTWESPPYADPDLFTERDLTVGSSPWELPGTLTIPLGEGPFPALILVHGSGPNDRDETLGPNKPFRDLAEGLAAAGIAVLRYDKRTYTYAQELASAQDLTVFEETVADALAAAEALRNVPEVAAGQIFVLGHSLGGMLIPRIGETDPDLAGFIVAAGPARPLEDLILEQTRYLLALEEDPTAVQQQALQELEQQVQRVKDPALSVDTPADQLPLGIPAAYWLDLRGYEPALAARDLGRPLLVLQGGRDYQVTRADFALWEEALGSTAGAELVLYPELNHLFAAGEGSSRPTEYLRAGHVAEEVVRDIARFIDDSLERRSALF